MLALQDQYAPKSICYGCGPANTKGLQIKSMIQDNQVIAHFTPQPHHQAFPNVLCGGVIGTLLDCHCNWASCWHLMQARNLDHPPCTVTAQYQIKLRRPTPMNTPLTLIAQLEQIENDQVTIAGQLLANDKICATCHAVFVAVKPGHPAYHRW